MARYHLNAAHVLDGLFVPPGRDVEWPHDPTPDMVPLDEAASLRFWSMPWAAEGWRQVATIESLPGGRHNDGSPVLLNRPENMGRPLTYNPPQPPRGEIPYGTSREPQLPRHPPQHFWSSAPGSIKATDPLRPYQKG